MHKILCVHGFVPWMFLPPSVIWLCQPVIKRTLKTNNELGSDESPTALKPCQGLFGGERCFNCWEITYWKSFLVPFYDVLRDVNGWRKRVRHQCDLAGKLKPAEQTIVVAGSTGHVLGAYDRTTCLPTLLLLATLCASIVVLHGMWGCG